MRDILVTAIVFASLPFILRRPQIGVMMWVWISVMNPHRLSYGFAYDFNFAAIIAGVTLVSAMISKDLKRPPIGAVTVLLFLFVAWTGVTTIFALYPEESYERWTTLMKTQAMVILIPMLFHKKEDLRRLLWVIVLSLAFFGAKGGAWMLLTGGGERVYGPPGTYIADNNAMAVAVIMIIPLLRYLQLTALNRNVRRVTLAIILFCGVAVIGSYSRGALLGMTAMLTFLWWKSERKLPVVILATLAIPLLLAFMPNKWFERMDTLSTYEQDASANQRLNSWATMINIANDRPLIGGGFEVAQPSIYERYSPNPLAKAHVAHSIYFQALGEHGYVGLGLYLLLYFTVWRTASGIIRATRNVPDLAWARDLSAMMQVTLVGFAVGGAFLSLVNFDVPYYLIGTLVATRALVDRELRAQTSASAQTNAPGSLARIGRNHSPKPGSG